MSSSQPIGAIFRINGLDRKDSMKHRRIQIAPSLLAADLSQLASEIKAIESAGVDAIHLDIMDGHFVPNLTFGFPVIERIRSLTKIPLDAHLMIENADCYIEKFARCGCDWISVHVEACMHLHRTLESIHEQKMKAGVAINPGTALIHVESVLDYCDFVLIMSVDPGYAGQKFIETSLDRVRNLKNMIGKRNVLVELDGGIRPTNFTEVYEAGVDIAVLGTGIFETKDYKKTVRELRALTHQTP